MGTDTRIRIIEFRNSVHLLNDEPTQPSMYAPKPTSELYDACSDDEVTPVLHTLPRLK